MHRIELKSGVNNCIWNIDGKCTNKVVTRSKTRMSRDWDSKQNCTITIIGCSKCGEYKAETLCYF